MCAEEDLELLEDDLEASDGIEELETDELWDLWHRVRSIEQRIERELKTRSEDGE